MARVLVSKFYAGNFFSNAVFYSVTRKASLQMNSNGSFHITNLSSQNRSMYRLQFLNMNMPIRKIGMDENGIIRFVTDLEINYILTINFYNFFFDPKKIYGILLDDCNSFAAFCSTSNKILYKATFNVKPHTKANL